MEKTTYQDPYFEPTLEYAKREYLGLKKELDRLINADAHPDAIEWFKKGTAKAEIEYKKYLNEENSQPLLFSVDEVFEF
jgi:hypothetical protein